MQLILYNSLCTIYQGWVRCAPCGMIEPTSDAYAKGYARQCSENSLAGTYRLKGQAVLLLSPLSTYPESDKLMLFEGGC